MKIPAVGESITEVTVAKWLKPDGAQVSRDEVIAELESDKATFELPAEGSGTLRHAVQDEPVVVGAGQPTLASKGPARWIAERNEAQIRLVDAESLGGDVLLQVPEGDYDLDVETRGGDADLGVPDVPGAERELRLLSTGGDVVVSSS